MEILKKMGLCAGQSETGALKGPGQTFEGKRGEGKFFEEGVQEGSFYGTWRPHGTLVNTWHHIPEDSNFYLQIPY
jgi:hypothetical protein